MFDDVITLRWFLETAERERLRLDVKMLSVSYLVPEYSCRAGSASSGHTGLEDWIFIWQGIALTESLKYIVISLIARSSFSNREYQALVLKPMMLLRERLQRDGDGGKLEHFDLVSYESTRKRSLTSGFEDAPFQYFWQSWSDLGGSELEVYLVPIFVRQLTA